MRTNVSNLLVIVSLLIAPAAWGQTVDVVGGQTTVALDFATLESAASLAFYSVSGDVIVPGTIADSVAFPINPRDAASLPTTFSYDPSDFLGTFSGSIEHTGSVFFNADSVEVGNFKIGFDAARAGSLSGAGTGFFVESTTGVAAILFDVTNIGTLTTTTSQLDIGADLAVSPEFGQFLFDNSLSASNLEGVVVGAALVQGVVPEPASLSLLMMAGLGLLGMSRRRS